MTRQAAQEIAGAVAERDRARSAALGLGSGQANDTGLEIDVLGPRECEQFATTAAGEQRSLDNGAQPVGAGVEQGAGLVSGESATVALDGFLGVEGARDVAL